MAFYKLTTILILGSLFMRSNPASISLSGSDNQNFEQLAQNVKSTIEGFYTSITYWDFDNVKHISDSQKLSMKKNILTDLLQDHSFPGAGNSCACPRSLLPFVCDTNGKLHSNICGFHCNLKVDPAIKPTMIFTETSLQKSKLKCQTLIWKDKNLSRRKDTLTVEVLLTH